jgi:1-acyl-sn-glycerol-3-phosphate acyltransferase
MEEKLVFGGKSMIFGGITLISAILAAVCACQASVSGLGWLLVLAGSFAGCFLGLTVLAFLVLVGLCAFVDMKKPQERDSKLYRTVMYPYIEALMQLVLIRLHTEGLEKTPKEGRFLLVCNHQNESDPGVLLHCFKKSQLAFISKKENANMFVVGKFMHKTLCQMIDRENDREALKTIIKCIQMIKEDKVSVGVFPEGGILVKDKLSHFRSGVLKIAQKTGVPIVVCTLKGTSDLFHNLKRLKKTRVRLHLVDVIPAEEVKNANTVELGEKIYQLMLSSLGPEYEIEAV